MAEAATVQFAATAGLAAAANCGDAPFGKLLGEYAAAGQTEVGNGAFANSGMDTESVAVVVALAGAIHAAASGAGAVEAGTWDLGHFSSHSGHRSALPG